MTNSVVFPLLLLLVNGLIAEGATTCRAGYWLKGATCVACAIGTYSEGGRVLQCKACPAGYSTITTKATSATRCTVCASGYGWRNSKCQACAKGSYAVGLKKDTCVPCKKGYTTRGTKARALQDCVLAAEFKKAPSTNTGAPHYVTYASAVMLVSPNSSFISCSATSLTVAKAAAAGLRPGSILVGILDSYKTAGATECTMISRKVASISGTDPAVVTTTPAALHEVVTKAKIKITDVLRKALVPTKLEYIIVENELSLINMTLIRAQTADIGRRLQAPIVDSKTFSSEISLGIPISLSLQAGTTPFGVSGTLTGQARLAVIPTITFTWTHDGTGPFGLPKITAAEVQQTIRLIASIEASAEFNFGVVEAELPLPFKPLTLAKACPVFAIGPIPAYTYTMLRANLGLSVTAAGTIKATGKLAAARDFGITAGYSPGRGLYGNGFQKAVNTSDLFVIETGCKVGVTPKVTVDMAVQFGAGPPPIAAGLTSSDATGGKPGWKRKLADLVQKAGAIMQVSPGITLASPIEISVLRQSKDDPTVVQCDNCNPANPTFLLTYSHQLQLGFEVEAQGLLAKVLSLGTASKYSPAALTVGGTTPVSTCWPYPARLKEVGKAVSLICCGRDLKRCSGVPATAVVNGGWPLNCTNMPECKGTCKSGYKGTPVSTCNSTTGAWGPVAGSCVLASDPPSSIPPCMVASDVVSVVPGSDESCADACARQGTRNGCPFVAVARVLDGPALCLVLIPELGSYVAGMTPNSYTPSCNIGYSEPNITAGDTIGVIQQPANSTYPRKCVCTTCNGPPELCASILFSGASSCAGPPPDSGPAYWGRWCIVTQAGSDYRVRGIGYERNGFCYHPGRLGGIYSDQLDTSYGTWCPSRDHMECTWPPDLLNLRARGTWGGDACVGLKMGETCKGTCLRGYRGNISTVCLYSYKWSAKSGDCTPDPSYKWNCSEANQVNFMPVLGLASETCDSACRGIPKDSLTGCGWQPLGVYPGGVFGSGTAASAMCLARGDFSTVFPGGVRPSDAVSFCKTSPDVEQQPRGTYCVCTTCTGPACEKLFWADATANCTGSLVDVAPGQYPLPISISLWPGQPCYVPSSQPTIGYMQDGSCYTSSGISSQYKKWCPTPFP